MMALAARSGLKEKKSFFPRVPVGGGGIFRLAGTLTTISTECAQEKAYRWVSVRKEGSPTQRSRAGCA